MITPRNKTSKKGADLPLDYIKMVKEVISKTFKKHVKDKTVVVEGTIYPEEIILRIGFKEEASIRQKNFEASVSFSQKQKNALRQINICVDSLGSMIDQYFTSDEELDLPVTWTEFKFDGNSVYLQTNGVNSDLEKEANALLGDLDEDLEDPDDK